MTNDTTQPPRGIPRCTLGKRLAYEALHELNTVLEDRIQARTAELKQTQMALYRQEKMASLGVLAAGLAHELNTPLGVVRSTSQLLERDAGENRRRQRLAGLCREASDRAGQIIHDLQAFSRPNVGDLTMFDLVEGVRATLRLLQHESNRHNAELMLTGEPTLIIQGYPAMLNQVTMNLVLNAMHAQGSQGGQIEIRITPAPPEHVEIVVRDSGPGLPDALRERIFEPFFTTRPPGEGTGLGLALCFTFVQAHHGEIYENGAPGQGARFVVRLPLEQPAG